jgi:hypothetical protein
MLVNRRTDSLLEVDQFSSGLNKLCVLKTALPQTKEYIQMAESNQIVTKKSWSNKGQSYFTV